MSDQSQLLGYGEYITWREKRLKNLTAPDGWLTLCGLFWLEEENKEYSVGSGESAYCKLPAGKTPEICCHLIRSGESVQLRPETLTDPFSLEVDGKRIESTVELSHDGSKKLTVVKIGPIMFFIIKRGPKIGVRVKDSTNPDLINFHGIESFPYDPKWRLEATFHAFDSPKTLPIKNVFGNDAPESSPGKLVFTVDGQTRSLDVIVEDDAPTQFFIIFKDKTNGKETYGMRYLFTELPNAEKKVILDFNRAYNPPCCFTHFATCPVPHPDNRLDLEIHAGEKNYDH